MTTNTICTSRGDVVLARPLSPERSVAPFAGAANGTRVPMWGYALQHTTAVAARLAAAAAKRIDVVTDGTARSGPRSWSPPV